MKPFVAELLHALLGYLHADGLILLAGVLSAVAVRVYAQPRKLRHWLDRRPAAAILLAVAAGAFTPLCACGTMAVVLSMLFSGIPWGAVMAFLVSSPLTSPDEFLFEASFLGWPFAWALLMASVAMGLGAGFLAEWLQRRWGFFNGQLREAPPPPDGPAAARDGAGAVSNPPTSRWRRWKLDQFARQLYELGLKRILLYFVIFIAIGQAVQRLVPGSLVAMLFGGGHGWSVPLAATIGLPLYVSGSSALPLLQSLVHSGAAPGAVLAFLISGKATGLPVIAGMATFLRRKALLAYVLAIWLFSMAAGFLYQLAG